MDESRGHVQAMIDKAGFKKALGARLKTAGFIGKGQSWFKEGIDATVVLNLQKSDYEEKYYVNFGLWLKSLGAVTFPSESKCHIQGRLASLFPEQSMKIENGCRIPSSENDFEAFINFITDDVVAFSNECLKTDSLKEMISNGRFKRALIVKAVKDALDAH